MGDRRRRSPLFIACLGAVVGIVMLLVVGGLALAVGEPLLFPSLGPTVFMQVQMPQQQARIWNTVIGHAVGVAVAVLALAATGATHTPPPITTGILSWQRELASALAVGLTIAGQVPLRAVHPPAAATTLLITLGAINPEWRAIAIISAGVILTAALGEAGHFVMTKALPDALRPPAPRHRGDGG
jgi:CBS-domain-containing membrane protein